MDYRQYKDVFSTKERVLELTERRTACFENVEIALRKQTPLRPTLFELLLNDCLFEDLIGEKCPDDFIGRNKFLVKGFKTAGYDYVGLPCPQVLGFPHNKHDTKETISLNEGVSITDDKSFELYEWPDYKNGDYSYLLRERLELPDGMKVIIRSDGGLLENLISIVGYDNLCMMLFDNEDLVKKITGKIGQALYDYYSCCLSYDTVGACFLNDDWGYKTQTMISPDDLRKYVFPWHKKITELIHAHNKYSILHSCGNLWEVMDDIIYQIKFDAKHSYEDAITPIEESYDRLKGKIALVGGIDIDFMCRRSPEEIYNRAISLLIRTKEFGGYLLGTGNSIPDYIPRRNVYALWCAALENEKGYGF